MTNNLVVFPALVLGFAALAQAQGQPPTPNKVAIIHVQNAILSTKDGQKAQADLQAKFLPRRTVLEKKQSEIVGMQDQLKKGSATMSQAAREKLMRKKADLIVANDVGDPSIGFDSDQNEVLVISRDGTTTRIEKSSKLTVANRILDLVVEHLPRD